MNPSAPALVQGLSLVLQSLRAVIAARAGRDRAAVPVVLLLWPYLHRLAARFQALVRRLQAGEATRARAARLPRSEPGPPRTRPPGLPRDVGWLIRLAPETAGFAQQIRHLLADPDLVPLLAAAPQAGRLLRPLCRMLGIEPGPDLPPALFHPSPARPRRNIAWPSVGTDTPARSGCSASARMAAPDPGGGLFASPVPA